MAAKAFLSVIFFVLDSPITTTIGIPTTVTATTMTTKGTTGKDLLTNTSTNKLEGKMIMILTVPVPIKDALE